MDDHDYDGGEALLREDRETLDSRQPMPPVRSRVRLGKQRSAVTRLIEQEAAAGDRSGIDF